MNMSIDEKFKQICRNINFKKNLYIVDFGTGTGILAHTIAKVHPDVNVLGTDISPSYISKCKKKYNLKNLDFSVISSNDPKYKFSFKGKSIKPDYVIFSSVLHEVYSYNKIKSNIPLTNEIERLEAVQNCLYKTRLSLKKGGKIIIRDFCGPIKNRYLYLKTEEKIPKKYSIKEFCKNNKFNIYPLLYHQIKSNIFLTNEKTLYEYIYHKDWRECWYEEYEERYGFWNKNVALAIVNKSGYNKVTYDILSGSWIKNHRMFDKILVSNYIQNDNIIDNIDCDETKICKTIWNNSLLPNYQILLVAEK